MTFIHVIRSVTCVELSLTDSCCSLYQLLIKRVAQLDPRVLVHTLCWVSGS